MHSDFARFAAVLIIATVCRTGLGQDTQQAESRAASAPAAQQAESRPASAPAAAPPPCAALPEKGEPYPIHGLFNVSYRGRTGDGSADNDLYAYLSMDGGNPEINDAIFHLLGRVTYDFEGASPGDPFNSLNDIEGSNVDSHVYEAFVELHRSYLPSGCGLERVRIGRQDLYAAFTYLVDGIRLDFTRAKSLCNARFTVFGGIPEYLYEDEHAGDWIAGFDTEFEPWRDGRLNIRYAHVQDSTDWSGFQVNNYAAVTLRQRLNDRLDVSAEWNTINLGTRDASCHFNWVDCRGEFEVHGGYRYQSTITLEYTTPYDPYVGVLGTSFAYHQIDLDASKLFCHEHLGIDAGISGRLLQNASDESTFNHDFARVWATLSAYRWPSEDVDLSLTGELWEASGEDTASIGGEITWRARNDLKITAGSYYSLYKSDLFVVDERQDATTIFMRAAWRYKDNLRFDGRLEYETSSDGDFWTGIIGLTWSF